MESVPAGLPFRTADKFPRFTKVVSKNAGCGKRAGYEACLRNQSVSTILAAQQKADKNVAAELGQFLSLFQPYTPTVGTPELKVQPLSGFVAADNSVLDVPVMIGSVRQEGLIFIYEAFKTKPLTTATEDALMALIYGGVDTFKVLKQYPRTSADRHDARNHTALFATDSLFHCAIRHSALSLSAAYASGKRPNGAVHTYHFDHVTSFGDKFWLPSVPICVDAVCHSEELPFVFDANYSVINASFTAAERVLALSMQTYWATFAKTGSPGSAPTGMRVGEPEDSALAWPEYESGSEEALRFGTPNTVDKARYRSKCNFWDELGYKWIL
jgi:carboxylesterase type B